MIVVQLLFLKRMTEQRLEKPAAIVNFASARQWGLQRTETRRSGDLGPRARLVSRSELSEPYTNGKLLNAKSNLRRQVGRPVERSEGMQVEQTARGCFRFFGGSI
jgi:hypothetical protein